MKMVDNRELDENNGTLSDIVDNLRQYNSNIGALQHSMIADDARHYLVELTNGRIYIPHSWVRDYKVAPASITEDMYRRVANTFPRPQQRQQQQLDSSNKRMSVWPYVIVILIVCIILFFLFR
jgi:hypothetical protein